VPGWDEYKLTMADLNSSLLTDPDLDLGAAIATLESDLTTIFQANAE
jgi:deoxycytidylate deaminase